MNEITTFDGDTGEIIDAPIAILPAMEQAEINMQITTARKFPRSLKQVSSRILDLVTLDEESAEECIYALPRGGKPIKGPSIRFAESLLTSYGNCRAASRVVEINRIEKYIEAEGVFFDLETNSATSARVRRRISDKRGKIYNDDMILMTGNAAGSIAKRNAILGGVPKPIWRKAYDAASRVLTGDVTTLAENREKAFKGFAAFGVKPEQIFTALAINGVEDLTIDHIGLLRGMYSTLKNGESTVEEMFTNSTAEKKSDPDYNPLGNAARATKEPAVEAQESASPKSHTAAEASQREIVSENGEVIKSVEGDATEKATAQAAYKIAPADPETVNDAQSAARDGLERAAPDVLDEDQTAHWYAAYDAQISEGDGE